MKKNIFYIPLLVILILIFVPASIYGLYKHKFNNPNNNQSGGSTLTFINASNEKIGTYNCVSNNCHYASTTLDTEDSYEGKLENTTTTIYLNKYAFIEDNLISLYDIESNIKIKSFTLIKNYGKNTNYMITKNEENKYGVLDLTLMKFVIDSSYDFIGSSNIDSENPYFIVLKDNEYYVIDKDNNEVSSKFSNTIIKANEKYIVSKVDNYLDVVDYNNNAINNDEYFTKVDIINNILIGTTNQNIIKIYNDSMLVQEVSDYDNMTYTFTSEKIEIYSNNEFVSEYLF